MQHAVFTRPGSEKTRIPHFLYIDEFTMYISKFTESLFTLYRKYHVGTIISAQNLSQLEGENGKENYKSTILANCGSKIFFGNNTPEDNLWWSKELGQKRDWQGSRNYDLVKGQYEDKISGIKYGFKDVLHPGQIQKLAFKRCGYKIKSVGGKFASGQGIVDFLESKYNEAQDVKIFNFSKFTPGMHEDEKKTKKVNKFDYKSVDFDTGEDEINPIQSDPYNTKYVSKNEDNISFDLADNKKTNE